MSNNKQKKKREKIKDEASIEYIPAETKAEESAPSSISQEVKPKESELIDVNKEILKQLNIQFFIGVSTTTLTLWWYLYNKICNFTGVESLNEQMCYIFVHYIDTITFLLCLCLTAVRSYLMASTSELKNWVGNLYKLFLKSWYYILGLCFLAIMLSGCFYFEWIFFAAIILVVLWFMMYDIGFKIKYIALFSGILIALFYFFIPSMTAILKSAEIKTDKPFYSFSDKVYITVNVRGYACRHKLVGLGEDYKDAKYYSEKGLIVMDATQIKNNEIAIATISPVAGLDNFMSYTWNKITGKEADYLEIDANDISAIKDYCNLTPQSVFVKP